MFISGICGQSSTGVQRIVGGKESIPGSRPWQAAMVRKDTGKVICGATIISEYHVVTAAHCAVL